jgi:hypothetical protein
VYEKVTQDWAKTAGVPLKPLIRYATGVTYYTVPDLVELLGISPGKIHRLLEEHVLAAVRVDGILSIPKDFIKDHEVVSSLRGTIIQLLDQGLYEEEIVEWLLADNEELGETPIAALRRGSKSSVRRAAQLVQ